MPFDRTPSDVKAPWHIVILQPQRIQPFFQRICLAGVAEAISKPDTAERRHFVKARATTRLQGDRRVGSDRDVEDVLSLAKILGNLKPCGRRELVICIQWCRMTPNAALLLKNPLSCTRKVV